jgi:hypothetical protein
VTKRAVVGTIKAITARIQATKTGTVINTAYIERLNATFRAAWAPLVRRGRAIWRSQARLTAAVYLVGTAYNFCWPHDSLWEDAPHGWLGTRRRIAWRTPAMAAGLTDHIWTMHELLSFHVPPIKPIFFFKTRRKHHHQTTPLPRAS